MLAAILTLQYSMFVMPSYSTQVSLDAAQVEEGIDVIDLPPHYPLLMIHRVHHLVLLHVPSVPGVIPASYQRPRQLTSKQNADNEVFTLPEKLQTTNSISHFQPTTHKYFPNHRTSPETQGKQMSKTVSKTLTENFENLSHTELYILYTAQARSQPRLSKHLTPLHRTTNQEDLTPAWQRQHKNLILKVT